MTLHAKRLRWIRESLRRPDGGKLDKGALSRALGWPDHRWKNLEGQLPWGDDSKAWVREGLHALVARMELPEEAGEKAVRYVMGETPRAPWSEPPAWKEGMCPEGKRPGRPPRDKARLSSGASRRAEGSRAAYDLALNVVRQAVAGEVEPEAVLRILRPDFWEKRDHAETEPFVFGADPRFTAPIAG